MTDRICARIEDIRREKGRVLVAIDGRCAAGKTTLALRLQEKLGCPLFHMDDFFPAPGTADAGALRPARRECGPGAVPG